MAQKKQATDYNALLAELKRDGPANLYLLFGEEEYLQEQFLEQLRIACVPEDDGFSRKRLAGENLSFAELRDAVDAYPFFSSRTFIEVRDLNLNGQKEADTKNLRTLVADIPEYCTLVFYQSHGFVPDGRLALIKDIKKFGKIIEFTESERGTLIRWVRDSFTDRGKQISSADAEYLTFYSGSKMTALLAEIEKLSSYCKTAVVSRTDIEAVAARAPETSAFLLVDAVAERKYDKACAVFSDLRSDKDNHPIMLLSLIGTQLRRMFALKICAAAGLKRTESMEKCGIKMPFVFDKTERTAASFSKERLAVLLRLCAEYDYKLKSSGGDPAELMSEFLMKMFVE